MNNLKAHQTTFSAFQKLGTPKSFDFFVPVSTQSLSTLLWDLPTELLNI